VLAVVLAGGAADVDVAGELWLLHAVTVQRAVAAITTPLRLLIAEPPRKLDM
jgi:hypothetical protein